MVSGKPKTVAIIGAGPAGLLLALALSSQNIQSNIYERRGPNLIPSGGVVLSPNAIKIIKPFGIYDRILPKGWEVESSDIVTEQGQVLDRHFYGHERVYGYKALRISRYNLLTELTTMVQARNNIELYYNSKFSNLVNDSESGVTFEINGSIHSADMIFGADGIHSSLRNFIDPTPNIYGGLVGIASIIPRNEVRYPTPDFPLVNMIRGQHGAFFTVPEDSEARTVMAGIQLPHPELDRDGWEALDADKEKLAAMLHENYDSWGDVSKSLIDSMSRHEDDLFIWPYYRVPELKSWASVSRRVILVGDAAHAIAPSSGQGVSQAFEDVYTLSLLLGSMEPSTTATSFQAAVDFWQRWRSERIKRLEKLVLIMNIKRMPEEERKKHEHVLEEEDLNAEQSAEGKYAWLFNTDFDGEMNKWIRSRMANGH